MSEETPKAGMSSKLQSLLIALVSVGLGAVLGYMSTGETPDPYEVTCDVAQEILESEACVDEDPDAADAEAEEPGAEEEAAVEAEEEATDPE
tara:strand:+ start:586 stop:861 length:276 start_codon:yes stop_codon:yes gene_type:complete